MLRIPCQSDAFPPGTIPNGAYELKVTWNDVVWAAVTVGRPNRHYVFRHGDASMYEAIFRWSLIRMALEQSGPAAYRLRRSNAARTLDPTEKGAVNYFLGMTVCKLVAAKLLNTPWLLHLDVFRPQLDVVLVGRSRPDLIGEELTAGRWHAFECKGRLSLPSLGAKTKAKAQASRVVSVDGMPCSLHIGAITYFRNEVLQFYWRDPPPDGGEGIRIRRNPGMWAAYYRPFLETFVAAGGSVTTPSSRSPFVRIEQLDLWLGIHPTVAPLLFAASWDRARQVATETIKAESDGVPHYQPDGLLVKAGPRWRRRFEEVQSTQG